MNRNLLEVVGKQREWNEIGCPIFNEHRKGPLMLYPIGVNT